MRFGLRLGIPRHSKSTKNIVKHTMWFQNFIHGKQIDGQDAVDCKNAALAGAPPDASLDFCSGGKVTVSTLYCHK